MAALFLGQLILALALSSQPTTGHADDSFREFDRRQVPTPAELYRALSMMQLSRQLKESDSEQTLTRELQSAAESFLSNLSAEEQQMARDIAGQFLSENAIPKDAQSTIEQLQKLQRQFAQQPGLKDALANSPELNNLLQRFAESNLPGTSASDPNLQGSPSSGSMQQPRDRSAPSPPPRGTDLPNDKDKLPTVPPESLPRTPGRQAVTAEAPKRSPSLADVQPEPPPEYAGARIDRILMEYAKRAMQETDLTDSESGLARSVNSLFERFVTDVHESMASHRPAIQSRMNRHWERLQHRTSRQRSRIREYLPWTDLSSNADGSAFERSSSSAIWLLPALGLLAISWFLWQRLSGIPRGTMGKRVKTLKFRMPSIKTSTDLVDAVDLFLLARFGTSSQWWHAGRAEAALRAANPQFAAQISELVKQYESARYTTGDLTSGQLNRSAKILVKLAANGATVTDQTELT